MYFLSLGQLGCNKSALRFGFLGFVVVVVIVILENSSVKSRVISHIF